MIPREELAAMRERCAKATAEHESARDELTAANAEIARLTAALKAERDDCDIWRSHWDREGYSARLAHNARVMDSIICHDARRAAEGKT